MASGSGVLWGEAPTSRLPGGRGLSRPARPAAQISEIVAALKKAPIVHKKAKDLLRASSLALLPADNPHVSADLKKIKKGTAPLAHPGRAR